MGAIKEYFGYKMELCCGLPFVTLTETVDDWKNVLRRAEQLPQFDLAETKFMSRWCQMLLLVLQNLVQSAEGNADFGLVAANVQSHWWRFRSSLAGSLFSASLTATSRGSGTHVAKRQVHGPWSM